MKPFYKISLNSILLIGLLLSCFSFFESSAQNAVVIGGNTPNPNAVLLLVGNGNQGLVIPITSDPAAINKVQGMIVYNKSDNNVYYCDGSTWKIAGGSGSGGTQTLTLSGNTLSISGGNNITIANSAPTQTGQVLMWNGSQWTSSSTTAPTATGQVLKWNNTTKLWEAGTDAGGTSYVAGTGISITGATIANTGVTSVSGNAPLSVISSTTTPTLSITQANTTTDGYLSKTDWNTFNSKLGLTTTPGGTSDITGNFNAGLQIGAGAIVNTDINAAAAIAGTKITPDFGTQNITTTGKTILNTVSYSWPGVQGAANTYLKNDGAGNVTWATSPVGIASVAGTAPITITNPTTTPTVSMSQANTTTDGYLTKTDWTTFNGKLDATSTPGGTTEITGSYAAGLQIAPGVISNIDISNTAAIAGTKISPDFGTQNITTSGKTVLNTVTYSWPGTQGAASTFLKNDGAGNLTWVTSAGSTFSTDKIIPRGNGTTLIASQLYDDGTNIGVGTITPGKKLDVNGDINIPTASKFYINNLPFLNNPGFNNTFVGEEAGINSNNSFAKAHNNLYVGWQSGKQNTDGQYNVFLGPGAGAANTTGSFDVYIGGDAGLNMISGNLNTFVGFNAGKASTTSISSTFVGNKAGEVNTVASYNTFLGERAGQANTVGEENTFVGRASGLSNTTGGKNTIIGSTADMSLNNLTNATAVGYGAIVGASDALVLGRTGTSVGIGTSTPAFLLDVNGSLRCFSFTNSSDVRWKKDITPIYNGLTKVLALKGVEYSWKKDQLKDTQVDDSRQIGFVAQDVEKVIPELVTTDKDGFKSVKYANITAVLVEAVKEQQSQIELLKKTIEALEAKLKLYEMKESDELAVIHAEIKKLTELVGLEAKAEKK